MLGFLLFGSFVVTLLVNFVLIWFFWDQLFQVFVSSFFSVEVPLLVSDQLSWSFIVLFFCFSVLFFFVMYCGVLLGLFVWGRFGFIRLVDYLLYFFVTFLSVVFLVLLFFGVFVINMDEFFVMYSELADLGVNFWVRFEGSLLVNLSLFCFVSVLFLVVLLLIFGWALVDFYMIRFLCSIVRPCVAAIILLFVLFFSPSICLVYCVVELCLFFLLSFGR